MSKQDRSWRAGVGCSHPTLLADSRGKLRRTHMSKHCLYCGLRFSDATAFCPGCGRPTASGFIVRPTQGSELERLDRELKEKDELIRRLVLALTMQGGASRASAHPADRSDSNGRPAGTTVRSSGRS